MISDLNLELEPNLELKRYPSIRFCFVVLSFSDMHDIYLIFVRDEFMYPICHSQNGM